MADIRYPLSAVFLPLRGYIRGGRAVGWPRAICTAVAASIVQWFSVHLVSTITTADVPLRALVECGLTNAVFPWRWMGPEEILFVALFFGGMWGFAGFELLWGRLLVRRRLAPGTPVWATLVKAVLVGTQSWACCWLLLLLLLSAGFVSSASAFWVLVVAPPLLLLVATARQSARLALIHQASGPVLPDHPAQAALPWLRHVLYVLAAGAILAGAAGASVLLLRPSTPPSHWPAAERVHALLQEASRPPSWIERNLNIYPYRREEDDIRTDLRAIGPEAVGPLIESLSDPSVADGLAPGHARSTAIVILGELRNPAAIEPLIRTLKDPRALSRAAAASILGEFKDPRAVASLADLLKDERWDVRAAAAAALAEMGPDGLEALRQAKATADADLRMRIDHHLRGPSTATTDAAP